MTLNYIKSAYNLMTQLTASRTSVVRQTKCNTTLNVHVFSDILWERRVVKFMAEIREECLFCLHLVLDLPASMHARGTSERSV